MSDEITTEEECPCNGEGLVDYGAENGYAAPRHCDCPIGEAMEAKALREGARYFGLRLPR